MDKTEFRDTALNLHDELCRIDDSIVTAAVLLAGCFSIANGRNFISDTAQLAPIGEGLDRTIELYVKEKKQLLDRLRKLTLEYLDSEKPAPEPPLPDLQTAETILTMAQNGHFNTPELLEKALRPVIRDTSKCALRALEIKDEAESLLAKDLVGAGTNGGSEL